MYLISSCLAGFNARYDGTSASLSPELGEKVRALIAEGRAIPLCPEQLGGLPTPRPPLEFSGGDGEDLLHGKAKALSKDRTDYSSALRKGAEEALRIALLYDIKDAILKDGSPSCGITYVYREGCKTSGMGVTASMLMAAGVRVKTVDSL